MRGGGGLHHTMVALKLQQFHDNQKKHFLWRLVFPVLFCQSAPPPPPPLGRGGVRWNNRLRDAVNSTRAWAQLGSVKARGLPPPTQTSIRCQGHGACFDRTLATRKHSSPTRPVPKAPKSLQTRDMHPNRQPPAVGGWRSTAVLRDQENALRPPGDVRGTPRHRPGDGKMSLFPTMVPLVWGGGGTPPPSSCGVRPV